MENKKRPNYSACIILLLSAIMVAQVAIIKSIATVIELLTAINPHIK